jgi:hypothetical protein
VAPRYQSAWFRSDVIAGAVVAAGEDRADPGRSSRQRLTGTFEPTVVRLPRCKRSPECGSCATPVSDDFDHASSTFAGRVRWVQIDLGEDADNPDHQISEEERFRIAMARQ